MGKTSAVVLNDAKLSQHGKPRVKRKGFLWEVRKNWILFLMLVPAMTFFLFNNYIPLVGLYYAFTNFNYQGGLFGSPSGS